MEEIHHNQWFMREIWIMFVANVYIFTPSLQKMFSIQQIKSINS
jgi:hypothetical protein